MHNTIVRVHRYALLSETIIMREREKGKIRLREEKRLKKFDTKMFIKREMQLNVDELYSHLKDLSHRCLLENVFMYLLYMYDICTHVIHVLGHLEMLISNIQTCKV